MTLEWKPIETLPPEFKDGREVIVGCDVATVWVTHSAWYRKPSDNPAEFDAGDEGWWWAKHSVTQEKLEGYLTPTHWLCETPDPPLAIGTIWCDRSSGQSVTKRWDGAQWVVVDRPKQDTP